MKSACRRGYGHLTLLWTSLAVLGLLLIGCALPALGPRPVAIPAPTVVVVGVPTGAGLPESPTRLLEEVRRAAREASASSGGSFRLEVRPLTLGPLSTNALGAPDLAAALLEALKQESDGAGVDLLVLSSTQRELVQAGLLLPLDGHLARLGWDPNDYYPTLLEAGRWRGQLYALPVAVTPLLLYYDASLLPAAGVGPPSLDWTWDNLVGGARSLTVAGGADGAGAQWGLLALQPLWLATLIWQAGGDILTQDGGRAAVADPVVLAAARMLEDLVLEHRVAPKLPPAGSSPVPWTIEAGAIRFGSARVAMAPSASPPSAVRLGGNVRISPVPRGMMAARAVQIGTVVGIHKHARDPFQAARALVALGAELQRRAVLPPTRTAMTAVREVLPNLGEADLEALQQTMETARAWTHDRELTRLFVMELVQPVLRGEVRAEAAVAAAARAIGAEPATRAGASR